MLQLKKCDTLEGKQTSEQENEDSIAEAPGNHPEEQERMEIVSQDPDYKEPKDSGK